LQADIANAAPPAAHGEGALLPEFITTMNRINQTFLRLAAGALLVSSAAVYAAPPSEATTGPTTAESSLRRISGTTITQDGTVLEGVYISGNVTVNADNVTIRNFKIETGSSYGVQANGKNLLLEDGEITGMASAGVYGSGFTARRLFVHNSGNDAFKPVRDVVIEDSYIRELGYAADSHADGVQMVNGGNVVIRRNNFVMHDQPGFSNSQVIIVQTNNGPVDNVTVEGNWINGGGFSLQFRDKDQGYGAPTNIAIRNNRFGDDYQFGPWSLDGNPVVCGNVWDDTGALMSSQDSGTCSGSAPPGTKKPATPALTSVQ
jgi:hypothetical protein